MYDVSGYLVVILIDKWWL